MNIKEAIERIKVRFDKWALDDEDMKAIQTLVPELKESEDERLRRLLVWQVHRNIEDETNDLARSVYDGIKGHDPDLEESIEDWKKCLAYLERLKERGPLSKDEEYTLARIIEYLEDNDCPSEWKDLLHDVYSLPYQKEQKPASVNSKKPNEDERIRKALLRCCDDWEKGQFGCMAKEDVPAIRAYLEKQKDERELSEGKVEGVWNEMHLKNAILAAEKEWGANSCTATWLKHLRDNYKKCNSRWKPSEGQMWALDVALENFYNQNDRTALESLRTDLQKLL